MDIEENPCPHCGKEICEIEEYESLRYDGDDVHVDCPSCDEPIHITISVSYDYIIEKDA